MRRPALGITGILALATVITAAGCGASGSSGASGNAGGGASAFNVLAILPTSGPLGEAIGQQELAGVKAAAQVVNSTGGIDGHRVVVTAQDDQGDATTAVSLLTKALAGGQKPNLVLEGASTAEAFAMVPLLARDKILGGGIGGSEDLADGTKYPYSFDIAPLITQQVGALVQYIKSRGYSNVGIFTGDEGYGQSEQAIYAQALTAAGLKVESVTYSASSLDLSSSLEKLAASKPDVILFEALGAAAPRVLQARVKAGLTTPMIGDLSITSDVAAQVDAPGALKNVSVFSFKADVYQPPAQQSQAMKTFLNAMKTQSPGLSSAVTHYSYLPMYDFLQLIKLAGAQAHSIDPDALKEALENVRQPQVRPYVLYGTEAFTPKVHFIDPSPDDFAVIPLSPINNQGFFKP